MKKILTIIGLIMFTSFTFLSCGSGQNKCTGDEDCEVCTDCSRCEYCSDPENSCGVCE